MIIIKEGRVIDPQSKTDAVMDLVIDQSKILKMAPGAAGKYLSSRAWEQANQIIDARGLVVCPGLIDVHVHFRDPGLTYKEDIHTGAKAAAKGGFTTVVCMANTKPPVDNCKTLEYVLAEGKKTNIHVLSSAAITMGLNGEKLTDMDSLKAHGAVGFTDDGMPLRDAVLVKQAMETAARLNVPLSFHEEDPSFIANNGINQGFVSARLGLGGSPALAEDIMVARDCLLALHTKASVNIQHISSANSVRMIELAKSMGADITAEVTPHHFSLDESAVLEHGSLAKMNPPLRTAKDREAIIQGLRKNVLDIIATDHAPHSQEEKSRPLPLAPSGIIGLETALALAVTNLIKPGHLTLMQLVEKMSLNPARLYRLDKGYLSPGAGADLTLFAPEEPWIVSRFASKSANSPFIGKTLYGKVKYTICDGKLAYQD